MNPRIIDPRLNEIAETRFSSSLHGAVVHEAYKACQLLLDAQTLSDISLMFEIYSIKDELLAVPVSGRWYITFQWDPDMRAIKLSLKRLE